MTIDIAAELWGELRRYVNTVDRDEAAESVVSILIDNDFDADDIRNAFKGDVDVKRALAGYLDNTDAIEDEVEVEDEVDDDDNYNNDWED
jgi:hypothetical protein